MMIMADIDYSNMDIGLSMAPDMKLSAVRDVAAHMALYTDGLYQNGLLGRPRRIRILPIDHGGGDRALPYIEGPLKDAMHGFEIEVDYSGTPLSQAAGYDSHSEYRPITTRRGPLGDPSDDVLLLMDSSAGTSACAKITGSSIMGGVVWACKQAASSGTRPRIMTFVVRDQGSVGVANFSVRTTAAWMGPRTYMRRHMPNAFKKIGGDSPSSPWNLIEEVHYSGILGERGGFMRHRNVMGACGLEQLF